MKQHLLCQSCHFRPTRLVNSLVADDIQFSSDLDAIYRSLFVWVGSSIIDYSSSTMSTSEHIQLRLEHFLKSMQMLYDD